MPPRRSGAALTSAGIGVNSGSAAGNPGAPALTREALATPSRAFPAAPQDGAPAAEKKPPVQLQLGRDLFRRGQVLRARETLLVAISEAPADVLFELACTFDPHYVNSLGGSDGQVDLKRALSLYEEAVKHGSVAAPAAVERLRRENPGLQ